MTAVPLTLALGDYVHTQDVALGRVRPQGIDLTWLELPVEEIFFRFTAYREWDVSELSLAKYVSLRAAGDDSLIAIPVFPSRVFRHSAVYVDARRIAAPSDLAGARIGVPEWAQTAGVYARGALMHEHGLDLASVHWFQGGVNEPGRREQAPIAPPAGVRLDVVEDRSLDAMLRAGDLDAVITARPPASFGAEPAITRLFGDFRAVEQASFERTGVFPIMHVIVLRAAVAARAPWAAMELYKAFEQAKENAFARLADAAISRLPVPWSWLVAQDGGTGWPYGVEPNRPTLEAFARFAHEQGVATRRVAVEELFAPAVQAAYRV